MGLGDVSGFLAGTREERTMPPSRAKANIIRELEVIENSPQCHTQMMISAIATTAPVSPNTSTKILEYGLLVSATNGVVKILDREEERHENEESKKGRKANRGYNTDRRTPRCFSRLLG